MARTEYISELNGSQIDDALKQLNERMAERYAKGTADGIPVNPGTPGYQDNAKYYAEQVAAVKLNIDEILRQLPVIVSEVERLRAEFNDLQNKVLYVEDGYVCLKENLDD